VRSSWKSSSAAHSAVQRPAAICVSATCELREVGLWQIDPVLLPVDGDVLPEVDQLQGRTDAVRAAQVLFAGSPGKMEQQAPDRVGRPPTVVEQLRVVGVALLDDILRKGVEQVAEQRYGQLPLGDDCRQLLEGLPGGRLATLDAVEFVPVFSQTLQADGVGSVAFIGNVVGPRAKR
jgi:hypothetical protein